MHAALRPTSGVSRALLWAVVGIVSAGVGSAADTLYYKQENGAIVFTNVRQTGLKPVPGFSSRQRIFAARPLPATAHDRYIDYLAKETGVSADLIKAVAMVESGLDPRARSPKGALGLMQLMPQLAREYGVRDAFDPRQNLLAGATHLSSLLDRYDGDLTLTLAAYNAGAGAVKRYAGVPPYRETRDYIRKVRDVLAGKASRRQPASSAGTGSASSSAPVRVVYAADGSISLVN